MHRPREHKELLGSSVAVTHLQNRHAIQDGRRLAMKAPAVIRFRPPVPSNGYCALPGEADAFSPGSPVHFTWETASQAAVRSSSWQPTLSPARPVPGTLWRRPVPADPDPPQAPPESDSEPEAPPQKAPVRPATGTQPPTVRTSNEELRTFFNS